MVNNIKLKLSKHLLCGFLSQRMQDVEEMTLRFSNFYSFMWLVTVLSYVAFGNLAPARFGQEGISLILKHFQNLVFTCVRYAAAFL